MIPMRLNSMLPEMVVERGVVEFYAAHIALLLRSVIVRHLYCYLGCCGEHRLHVQFSNPLRLSLLEISAR